MQRDKIVEGKCIGKFRIGLHKAELFVELDQCDYEIENLDQFEIVRSEPYSFWVSKDTMRVTQILVREGFKGEFLEHITLGSTLDSIRNIAGPYYEELDVYMLENYPGICFELADADDWDELKSPVSSISIFEI